MEGGGNKSEMGDGYKVEKGNQDQSHLYVSFFTLHTAFTN
jgi:hypothetical protein